MENTWNHITKLNAITRDSYVKHRLEYQTIGLVAKPCFLKVRSEQFFSSTDVPELFHSYAEGLLLLVNFALLNILVSGPDDLFLYTHHPGVEGGLANASRLAVLKELDDIIDQISWDLFVVHRIEVYDHFSIQEG